MCLQVYVIRFFFRADRAQDLGTFVSPLKLFSALWQYQFLKQDNQVRLTNNKCLCFSKPKAALLDVEFVATLAKL